MSRATLTSKGQVTLPKQVRDRLQLEQGDVLDFELLPGGEVRVSRREPRPTVFGMLKSYAPEKAVTVEEMNEAIAVRAASRYERGLRAKKDA